MFSDFDCPTCKGLGDRLTGSLIRAGQIARHIRRCRRCHGTGLI